jgi:hypothetical protein
VRLVGLRLKRKLLSVIESVVPRFPFAWNIRQSTIGRLPHYELTLDESHFYHRKVR